MRPTWSSGTCRRTSGAVEVLDTLGAEVVGVLVPEAVALAVALAPALLVIGGVSKVAAELVCANTCAANAKRNVTNRRRIESDMLGACKKRVEWKVQNRRGLEQQPYS
jgi:hypothetical protein